MARYQKCAAADKFKMPPGLTPAKFTKALAACLQAYDSSGALLTQFNKRIAAPESSDPHSRFCLYEGTEFSIQHRST